MRVKLLFLPSALFAELELGRSFAVMVSTRRSSVTRKVAAKKARTSQLGGTMKKGGAASPEPIISTDCDGCRDPLFSLAVDEELVEAKLTARPSKRNRSPYVADVWLEAEQREAIAHVPNLDMGGKCVPGASLLLKPARGRNGVKIGADAVSPKYGTPKCEFITQLLLVDESHLEPTLYPPTWVGAHPSLGERIAETWLRNNLIPDLPRMSSIQTQIRNPCGANMRSDFLVTQLDGTKRIVEVKTVVDTDYASSALPNPEKLKCIFASDQQPYSRTAIFPWGKSNQKGPDGEKVVSARAIHHVQELTRIAKGTLRGENGERYKTTVLFVVIRGDAESFRPNHEACPSLCKYLRKAEQAGVQILAKRVTWGTGLDEGKCFDDKMLPVQWPDGY